MLSDDQRCVVRQALWLAAVVAVVSAGSASTARGQRVESRPQLGLGASSAFGLHGGAGAFRHSALGPELGGALDLGWIGSRRVRLSVGVDYLATMIDRPDSLGAEQRGRGYVFSALADVTAMSSLARVVAPYVGVGVGVDAVGTTIRNEQIGTIYNTNVFNVHGRVGALVRVAPRGRLSVEVRGTGARVVRRVGARVGYVWLYNDFASPR